MDYLNLGIAVLFALATGSFLTVCIYRIPHGRPLGPPEWNEEGQLVDPAPSSEDSLQTPASPKNLSIFSPSRSFCPHCNNQLLWRHNIPLASWFFLRGKCGFCKAPIPFRYPLVELLSGLFAVLSAYQFGFTWTALVIYAFCAMLIVLSFIDIDYYIIPDVISLPGIVVGFGVGLLNEFFHVFQWPIVSGVWASSLGILFGGGVLFAISEIYFRVRKREGLGMGDVKLLALTGAFFGIEGALYTMFIGSLLGSVIGITLILLSGKKMTYQLPFGPYLALGTVAFIFFARPLHLGGSVLW